MDALHKYKTGKERINKDIDHMYIILVEFEIEETIYISCAEIR